MSLLFEHEPTAHPGSQRRGRDLLGAYLRRYGFGLRLALALLVSMALLVGASQIYFTNAIKQQLIDQGERFFTAEGQAVERAFDDGDTRAEKLAGATALVDNVAARPDVVSATIFDSRMRAVIADEARRGVRVGERDPNPKFHAALSEGRGFAGLETESEEREDGGAYFEFVVPLELGGERYVLEVDQDASEFNAQVSALRDKTIAFSTAALLVALVLFYLLGGRALARRHGRAVRRATRDPLTGLGNHSSFREELARAIASTTRRGEPLALALIDLDDFKFVNDRFGHRRGDEALAETASVLASGRAEDRAFRIGGDEFALLMPGSDGRRARAAIQRLLARAIDNADATSFTAGIAVSTSGVKGGSAALWEQADAAMYEGKRTGGGRVVVFDEVAATLSIITPDKVHAVRSLLAEPRLQIAFQPIWRLQDREILGFEALARLWEGYGFEGPAEAFAIAEKIGRAHELDAICRAATLERARELPADTLLFLNVNPASLTHNALDGDRLSRALKAVGVPPQRVVLEITERSEARLDHVVAGATRLRGLGFGLALDDVGAGNAGLEMLRDLKVDYVKIDTSVITKAVEDPQTQAVLVAIIAYARRANAFVIAEGIESEEILGFVEHAHDLDVMGEPAIDGGQGFLLGQPLRFAIRSNCLPSAFSTSTDIVIR